MSDKFERLPDQIDQAQQINEAHQEASLAAARLKNAPQQVQNPDGTWPQTDCDDCGEPIPEGRLKLAKIRCVDCQSLKDRRDSGLF